MKRSIRIRTVFYYPVKSGCCWIARGTVWFNVVNEKENENGEKQENNEFVNEN